MMPVSRSSRNVTASVWKPLPSPVHELGEVRLQAGDSVVLYSDGVSEAANASGEEFGEDRIMATVRAVLERRPQEVLDALFAALRDFTRGAGVQDDMTAVVLRYGVRT